jgi:hypothetical protein
VLVLGPRRQLFSVAYTAGHVYNSSPAVEWLVSYGLVLAVAFRANQTAISTDFVMSGSSHETHDAS